MVWNEFPKARGGKNVPNPIFWHASQMGTLGNEVSPIHRLLLLRGLWATRAQAKAMV